MAAIPPPDLDSGPADDERARSEVPPPHDEPNGPQSGEPGPDRGREERVAEPPEAAGPPQPAEEDREGRRKKKSRPFWVEIPALVVIALVIAIVIKTFLVQAFFIPSGSMEDTLAINDRILVNKLAFRFEDPNRFDVVVFDSGRSRDESFLESVRRNVAEALGLSAPESDFIKRVIGLPGEVLEIRDNRVLVDGVAIDEPYLHDGAAMSDFGPVVIEADSYFMMGDNRNLSSDSRFSGTVSRDRMVGRAFVIVWPPGSWDGL